MKKALVLAALAVVVSAPAALAGKGDWFGGGQAGVHVPTGDYADVAKTGFVAGVFADYMVTDQIAVGADFAYNSADGETAPGLTDPKFTLFNYGVHGRALFVKDAPATPYAIGGLGMYSLKYEWKQSGLSLDNTDTKFGVNGGLGIDYRPATSPVGFGVEGAIHNIFTDGQSTTYFTVTGRVMFSFSDVTQK